MAEKHRIRTDRFSLALLPEEKEILARNAKEFGLSRTEYLRRLILFGGITGQPMLDKETGKKLIRELDRISKSVKTISFNTPPELMAEHPEWSKLETAYMELLAMIGQLTYAMKGDDMEWQQQASIKLHRR